MEHLQARSPFRFPLGRWSHENVAPSGSSRPWTSLSSRGQQVEGARLVARGGGRDLRGSQSRRRRQRVRRLAAGWTGGADGGVDGGGGDRREMSHGAVESGGVGVEKGGSKARREPRGRRWGGVG